MIGSLAAYFAHERACMREMMTSLHEQLRRKAQETIGKEETMPTLLEDLKFLYYCALEFGVCANPDRADRARDNIKTFIEANTPWLPPQQEGFGPWIEWKPGDPGPRVMDEVSVLLWRERENRRYKEGCVYVGHEVHWSRDSDDDTRIVAYCVKLPEVE